MSQRHAVQDATGILATDDAGNTLIIVEPNTPSDLQAGYSPGCLHINTADGQVKVNERTLASSAWIFLGSHTS